MPLSKSSMVNRKISGFSLLEVTLVILIVVVLASLAFAKFVYVIERAKSLEAVKVLREVKKLQIFNKEYSGEYAGNGGIEYFPDLMFKVSPLQYFHNITVNRNPSKICTIFRNDGTYHLYITDDGIIHCSVDDGPDKLCKKLGFINNGY